MVEFKKSNLGGILKVRSKNNSKCNRNLKITRTKILVEFMSKNCGRIFGLKRIQHWVKFSKKLRL